MYNSYIKISKKRVIDMNRIQSVETRNLRNAEGGCGECQTSCQSACKTSCGVANQPCESTGRIRTVSTRSLRSSVSLVPSER